MSSLGHECDPLPWEVVPYGKHGETWALGWIYEPEAKQLKAQGYEIEKADEQVEQRSESLTTYKQALSACTSTVPPANNTFCGYSRNIARCEDSISSELQKIRVAYPSFTEAVSLGTTHQGREMLALRIGKLTQPGDTPSPQTVLVAGQHGSTEIITSEMAMRTIRYFVSSYANNTNGVRALLQDRTLVVVPSANPDGLDYYFACGTPANPMCEGQRLNSNPCPGEPDPGVDLNRNHGFDWGLYFGPNKQGCGSGGSGFSANSEPETQGLNALLNNTGTAATGEYITSVMTSFHSANAVVGFAPGVDKGRKLCGLPHEDPALSNCTPPDHDVLATIFGSQRPNASYLQVANVPNGRPYESGSKGRVFAYGIPGSLVNTVTYGDPSNPQSVRALAALVELTGPCISGGLGPIEADHTLLANLEGDVITLVTSMLHASKPVLEKRFLSDITGHDYGMPHIYRINPKHEHPTLRVGALESVQTPQVEVNGAQVPLIADRTLVGVHFKTWMLDRDATPPEDPYLTPAGIVICPEEPAPRPECHPTLESFHDIPRYCLGNPDTGCSVMWFGPQPLDLCTDSNWDTAGWQFVGKQTVDPSEQCYWELASPSGVLIRHPVDLSEMGRSRLVFSYRAQFELPGVGMTLEISNNGFNNCQVEEGTGCRIIQLYYHSGSGRDGKLGVPFRTETFDVSDFDLTSDVQVRFSASGLSGGYVRIYDVHFAGWKVP